MGELIDELSGMLANTGTVDQGLRVLSEVLTLWIAQTPEELLRQLAIEETEHAREQKSPRRYFPSKMEIDLWPRDQLTVYVIGEYVDQALRAPWIIPVAEHVHAVSERTTVETVCKDLSYMQLSDALQALAQATKLWINELDSNRLEENVVASGRDYKDWNHEDYIKYIYLTLYSYFTGL